MQLLVALLATAAVAVACLPTQNRSAKSNYLKNESATGSVVVLPERVIEPQVITETQKRIPAQQGAVFNANSSARKDKQAVKPKMTSGYRIPVDGNNFGYRMKPRIPTTTTTKRPTTTQPYVWPDYGDYGDYPGDHANYDNKPLPLCPDETFRCERDCESKKFYSGYCEKNQCICFGKLA